MEIKIENAINCPCGKPNDKGHFIPYQTDLNRGYCQLCGFDINPNEDVSKVPVWTETRPEVKQSFISIDTFKKSLIGYEQNNIITYLVKRFGSHKTSMLVAKFYIGTSKYYENGSVFWNITEHGKIASGAVVDFDPQTAKETKPRKEVHELLKLDNFQIKPQLFGLHQLQNIRRYEPIAICQSEFTALVMSVIHPRYAWMSGDLNHENLKPLKGRDVMIFPNKNNHKNWAYKSIELGHLARIRVNELLLFDKKGCNTVDEMFKYDISSN